MGAAAEQIIAGVVVSEQLAVTMYGAIHRAQFAGQRDLRGLIVDPKMLADDSFRAALIDSANIASVTRLAHANIVPTVGVESGGADVVVVTRGVGRYVSVQDLIATVKSRSVQGGKLPMPIAGLIGKSVIEALSAAHKAGVVHGAVHPRSVLIDEDGGVRVSDFVVGRALTTAVAQGAESSLWRGLSGFIAPELVVGEAPTPGADVFAVGAMLFTLLAGELPPGSLRATPAVERLVQRALDTDVGRRYRNATDLLENFLEALEDDRWDIADRNELIREAGLSQADANIDEATEDLLASLGAPSGVQFAPMRVSAEQRAVAHKTRPGEKGSLDALLASIDEAAEPERPAPRRKEKVAPAPVARVPSLDDPDEPDEVAAIDRTNDVEERAVLDERPADSADESAAMKAIAGLDKPAPAAPVARPAAAPAAAPTPVRAKPMSQPPAAFDLEAPTPRLKSPLRGVFAAVILLGMIGGGGYLVYQHQNEEAERAAQHDRDKAEAKKNHDEAEAAARERLADPGAIAVTSTDAGVWLRLGRTPLDTTIHLQAAQPHDFVLLHDGQDMTEAQVNGPSWTGAKATLKANLAVTLKPRGRKPAELPLQPTTPVLASTGVVGDGPVHIDSTPSDAEVWLFLGTSSVRFNEVIAGRDYELAVVRPGYKTQHVVFKAEDWRDGGDANVPIDVAKKKAVLEKTVELEKAK